MIEVEQVNKRYYKVNDAVTIKVAVKNVEQLAVKVYALQQKNYYAQYGHDVDIDMNLDGLTANWVITKLRSRTVVIKELKEIVGNGKRACAAATAKEFDDEIKDNDLEWSLWSVSVGVCMCLLRMLWACC